MHCVRGRQSVYAPWTELELIGSHFKFLDLSGQGLTNKDLKRLSTNPIIFESLDLSQNQFSSTKGAKIITRFISHSPHLTDLNLDGTTFLNKGIADFCEYLEANTTLVSLRLGECSFDSRGMGHLVYTLFGNTTLTSLNLHGNYIDEFLLPPPTRFNTTLVSLNLQDNNIGTADQGLEVWCQYFSHHFYLTSLNLSRNFITDEGVKQIAEYLETNPNLLSLNLASNQFNDLALFHLGSRLLSNNTLTHLDLNTNEITAEGILQLDPYLRTNTSLTSLNLSSTKIFDKGLGYLLQAIAHNYTILDLGIHYNVLLKTVNRTKLNDIILRNEAIQNHKTTTLLGILLKNMNQKEIPIKRIM